MFSVLIHELRGLCLDTQLLGGEYEGGGKRRKQEAQANTASEADSGDLLSGSLTL